MAKRRGEVVAVKDLFSKYKNTLIAPQSTVELELIRVVGEVIGITLKESQVSYTVSTRTLSLTASGMIKQEVKLREKEVLKELARRLGSKNAPQAII
jgi:hypothetical protein